MEGVARGGLRGARGALRLRRPRGAADRGASARSWRSRSSTASRTCSPRRVAARHEQARSLGDVLLRRTRLGLLAAREVLARPARPRRCAASASVLARELGWDEAPAGGGRRLRRRGRGRGDRLRAPPEPARSTTRRGARASPARGRPRRSSSAAPVLMGIVNASPDSLHRRRPAPRRSTRSVALAAGCSPPAPTCSTSAASPASTGPPARRGRRGDRARRAADRAARGRARRARLGRHLQAGGRGAPRSPPGARIVNDVSGLRDPELADGLRARPARRSS